MDDLIRRQDAIDVAAKEYQYESDRITALQKIPAVELPTWIPCSERLPKSENKYGYVKCNVTVMRSHYPTSSYDYCDAPYDEYFVTDAMYDVSQKIWHLGEHTQLNALIDIEDLPLNCDYVIAWQPLPEPYKGEQHETN